MLSTEYFVSCGLRIDTHAFEYKKVNKWHIYPSQVQLLHFLTSVCPLDDFGLSKTNKWI